MIRAFDWRDVGLVKALGENGVCLDSETGLTRGCHPLTEALLTYLMPGPRPPTVVWREHRQAAFGQLRHRPGQEQARVLYIAPACAAAADGWPPLLEQLAAEAGRRGAQVLIAEVSEEGEEFEVLRAGGFAVYARQSLWRLKAPPPAAAPAVALRPATSADAIGVSVLYGNLVPRLVQQVEPAPAWPRGYVLQHDGELIAFLDVRRGPRGIWLDPYLHPEADELAGAVVRTALQLLPDPADLPVYICVRRYQDWLQDVLSETGFVALGTQAMLVKRLVVRVMEPLLKPLPIVDHQAPTPVVRARVTRHN